MNGKNSSIRLKTTEAAVYVGKAPSSLEKLRLTGSGPRYIKLGKTVVYDVADLDAWLNANKRTSTSST